MAKQSFAENLNNSDVMIEGLKANQERVAQRGIKNEFITEMETDVAQSKTLNSEQEKMKAALKKKTAELNSKMASLDAKYKEAKKVVKLEMEQSLWKEFGIQDKK